MNMLQLLVLTNLLLRTLFEGEKQIHLQFKIIIFSAQIFVQYFGFL